MFILSFFLFSLKVEETASLPVSCSRPSDKAQRDKDQNLPVCSTKVCMSSMYVSWTAWCLPLLCSDVLLFPDLLSYFHLPCLTSLWLLVCSTWVLLVSPANPCVDCLKFHLCRYCRPVSIYSLSLVKLLPDLNKLSWCTGLIMVSQCDLYSPELWSCALENTPLCIWPAKQFLDWILYQTKM